MLWTTPGGRLRGGWRWLSRAMDSPPPGTEDADAPGQLAAVADEDEFDADEIYGRSDSRWDDKSTARGGGGALSDEDEDKKSGGGCGCRVFIRGLPFSHDRAQIRAIFGAFGAISQLTLQKARPGTATIEVLPKTIRRLERHSRSEMILDDPTCAACHDLAV